MCRRFEDRVRSIARGQVDHICGFRLPISAPNLLKTRTPLSVAAYGPIMILTSEIRAFRKSSGNDLLVKAYML